MPAHITGATAGSAARFAGIDTSGTASKWSASSGVVATLATAVSHRAPAIGPRGASGRAATIPATAANESCQPASPATRGFAASVTAAASSSAYEADAGREAESATSPAAPITAARCSDGPAPASGTYRAIRREQDHDARPGRDAGERRATAARARTGASRSAR